MDFIKEVEFNHEDNTYKIRVVEKAGDFMAMAFQDNVPVTFMYGVEGDTRRAMIDSGMGDPLDKLVQYVKEDIQQGRLQEHLTASEAARQEG